MRKIHKTTVAVAVGVLASFFVAGCDSIGSPPAGMSGDEAKAAIERMPPEQKIKSIANSPMPQAEKEKEYAKIEAETGVKASTVLSGAGGPPPGGG